MGIAGWILGMAGIVVLVAPPFQLQRDWFDVGKSQKPRLSKQVRRLYVGGAVLGFGLFIFAMIVGPRH